uniref:Ycf36 n=1 Tax=Rhodymenia pseudopalmata TaxID=31502 RepID=A0A1C9C7E2_RHOPU|nr:hypothetical protein Rhodyp_016 [Rhodymenia pseudopalmata]AOM64294.1 hypothetical protein Rhodyp_016 [Rhodymenia pseudopalmata]
MCIQKNRCPVPFHQQPLNEYCALKSSWFFNWSTLIVSDYILSMLYIFSIFFVLFMPLSIFIISNDDNFWKVLLIDFLIVNFIFVFIFVRLYLGWSYVTKRLISATVFYEESGWYDGQIWIKNIESLTKDRLIGLYEVTPFMLRIRYSLIVSLVFLTIDNLLYLLVK